VPHTMCLNLMWENDIALVWDIADKICFASQYKIHSNRKERYSTYDEKSYDSYISSNQSTSTPIKKKIVKIQYMKLAWQRTEKKSFYFLCQIYPVKFQILKRIDESIRVQIQSYLLYAISN
jgi:hypothetical protein